MSRVRVNPALPRAVRASGIPVWKLAFLCGVPHSATTSSLLHADSVPDTLTNVERLYRIADAVGFPRAYVLLDESSAAEREQARRNRQDFTTMPVAPHSEGRR